MTEIFDIVSLAISISDKAFGEKEAGGGTGQKKLLLSV